MRRRASIPASHAAPGQPMMPPAQPAPGHAAAHVSGPLAAPATGRSRRRTRSCCRAAAGSTPARRRRIPIPGPRSASMPSMRRPPRSSLPASRMPGSAMPGSAMPGQPMPGQPGAPAVAPGFPAPAGLPGPQAPQSRQGMPAYQAAPPPPAATRLQRRPGGMAPWPPRPGLPARQRTRPGRPRPASGRLRPGAPPGPALVRRRRSRRGSGRQFRSPAFRPLSRPAVCRADTRRRCPAGRPPGPRQRPGSSRRRRASPAGRCPDRTSRRRARTAARSLPRSTPWCRSRWRCPWPTRCRRHTAEGFNFGQAVARDAPALWLEAVLARKPRMPSDLEARLLQDSSLPIDSLLHDEVRHALRRGFWDALERVRH